MALKSVIKTIYLYLVTFVGLIMFAISLGVILNASLRLVFFPDLDRAYPSRPPEPAFYSKTGEAFIGCQEVANKCKDNKQLSNEEQLALSKWQKDYQTWEREQKEYDATQPKREQQRRLVDSVPYVVIGAILYLTHWRLVKRERDEV
ncbi:MAG: hypothetical protein V1707_00345 [bacterium]